MGAIWPYKFEAAVQHSIRSQTARYWYEVYTNQAIQHNAFGYRIERRADMENYVE